MTEEDRAIITAQLGRTPRSVVGIGARCICGRPTVTMTAPRLADGTPFPTFYYLTHPEAAKACSRLEARGVMAEWTAELAEDSALAAAYAAAHRAYLSARDRYGEVEEIAGISAGGMPSRVKCLHALVAHSLAAGPGVNPLGDRALAAMSDDYRVDCCQCSPDMPSPAPQPIITDPTNKDRPECE